MRLPHKSFEKIYRLGLRTQLRWIFLKKQLYLHSERPYWLPDTFLDRKMKFQNLKKKKFLYYVCVLNSNIYGHSASLEHHNIFSGSKSKKRPKPVDQKKPVLIYPKVWTWSILCGLSFVSFKNRNFRPFFD